MLMLERSYTQLIMITGSVCCLYKHDVKLEKKQPNM